MGCWVDFPSIEEMVFGNSTFATNENAVFAGEWKETGDDRIGLPLLHSLHFDTYSFCNCVYVQFESGGWSAG